MQVRRALLRHEGIYKCNALHSNHFKLRIRNKRITNTTNTKKSKKLLFPSTIIDVGDADDDTNSAVQQNNNNNNRNDDDIVDMEDGRLNDVTIHATAIVTDIPVEHHLHHHHQSDSHHNNNNHFNNRGKLLNEQNHNRHHDKGHLPAGLPAHNEVTTSGEIEISLEPIINLVDVGANEKSPATEWATAIHHHQRNNQRQQQSHPNTNTNQHLYKNNAKRIDVNNGETSTGDVAVADDDADDDDNDNGNGPGNNAKNTATADHRNDENNINNHYGKDDEDISVINLNGQVYRGIYADNANIRNTQLAITDENPTTDNDSKNSLAENKSAFVDDNFEMVQHGVPKEHNNHTTDLTFSKEFITKCIKCLKYTNSDSKIVMLEDVMGQSLVLPTPPISIQPNSAPANSNTQNVNGITTATNSLQITKSPSAIHSATTASPIYSNNIHSHNVNNINKASYTNNFNRNETNSNVANTPNTKIQKGERHMLAMFFIFFIYVINSRIIFCSSLLLCCIFGFVISLFSSLFFI